MRKLSKKILLQINLLVAAGILLSYASNHVNPANLWPIAFFGLAYPYLLLANVIFLGLWIWRRNKYAFVSAICIAVGYGNIGRFVQLRLPQDQVVADSSNIKLVTFNVRTFNGYNWDGNNIGRDSIINYVTHNKPDIVCFQEFVTQVNHKKRTEEYTSTLLCDLPFRHINYSFTSNYSRRNFGVATYSKYPIVKKGSIQFEDSYNTCIFSDLLYNRDTIRIYNVHLQSISLRKDYTVMDSLMFINSKRLSEVKDISDRLKIAFITRAKQVHAVKKHADNSPYPVIICGDFNDTPVSYSYNQLLGDKSDSFRESGSGFSKTYRGKLPSFRIDYIFHDNKYQTSSYCTPKVRISDHYPVIAVLKYEQ